MSDILFVKTSSLGDVIHHMPALTDARRQRPAARFSWVVEEAFAPLVRLHPAVDQVIPVASRRWRGALLEPSTWREIADFRRVMRARRYDEIIDTQGLFRSGLMVRLARGRRHGYDAESIRERAASWFYDVRHHVGRERHAIARNRILTGLALDYAPGDTIDFGLAREQLAAPTREPYAVLLHATARRDKEWPLQSWIALGQALREHCPSLVVPWGKPHERERSERIAAVVCGARVPVHQPIDEVARLIAGASFAIGVDTGLLHLAAAFGVPLIAIFVGSEPGLTGPLGRGPIGVVGNKGELPSVADVVRALTQLR
jgi:heptosyltransferase-1